jgi:hypothetical protein
MTAAALHPFLEAAERDFALFNVAQLAASHVRWWLVLLLWVILFPIAILPLAQVVPFLFRRHVALAIPHLPNIDNPADLAWVKDVLTLYHESLKVYARFSLFRRQAQDVLDELDEELDSLEFVTTHKDFLDKAVAQIEQQ